MNLKLLFKTLSFFLVASFVFASETNDCYEIKEYLEKKSFNSTKTIEICSMNDQGKVIQLKVNNEDLQEEDVNKILSYNTIKDLEYVVVFNLSEEWDTPYSRVLIPHPGYTEFPYIIVNFSELEKLNFYYEDIRYVRHYPSVNLTSIEDGTFKLFKNLKNLTLSQVNVTNENLKELSTLTSLEEIDFIKCSFDNDGFSSFENHENLSKLSLNNIAGRLMVIPSYIGKIKSLKEIYIDGSYCEEGSYDFSELNNLESLYLGLIHECNFDLSKNEKLTELSIISIVNFNLDTGMKYPISLEFPYSLKKLILNELVYTSDNYRAIISLPNLEELTMSYHYDYHDDKNNSEEFEIKSLESRDKLRKLTINGSNMLKYNSEFLNELVNLTYLDISNNDLTEIPQVGNLKKLEYINLLGNRLTKFPTELTTMKNLEYINLNFNAIYDELPESLSQLENLKYFDVGDNKKMNGKVLTNKSLEKCIYSEDDDLCIPKGYELNCLDEEFKRKKTFRACEKEINVEENTDEKCVEVIDICLVTDEPSTENPSTEKPTTENPTTEKPNTEKPNTENPTTEKPTIENPTTEKPIIENPITEKLSENPLTLKPSTDNPITVKPTTENPITVKPITESPITMKPTTENPITVKPITESPITMKPTTENPITVKPTTENPITVKPTTENPITVKPTTENPITVKPTTENPITVKPTTENPITVKPTTENPITVKPTTENPVTVKPTTENSITVKPNEKSVYEESTADESLDEDPSIENPLPENPLPENPLPENLVTKKSSTVKPTTNITTFATVTVTTTINNDNESSSTVTYLPYIEGKCGEGYGRCPSGQCCSKYGWCGKSDTYCTFGCKPEFGDCKNMDDISSVEPAVKERCGEGIGNCSLGYCCSKSGLCGKSYGHCAISVGCQPTYGICTKDNTSIEGRCGESYGKCRPGYCCSQQGWCGTTEYHCSSSNGCQSEFGLCK